MLESLLAFFHIVAFVMWVVFAAALAALCRSEWLNAPALRRMARLDALFWFATALVIASGLMRVWLGKFGAPFYWANWLLHLKLTVFAVVLVLQALATRRLAAWRALLPALPAAADVRRVRLLLIACTHVMALLPLAAVFMARGFGVRD